MTRVLGWSSTKHKYLVLRGCHTSKFKPTYFAAGGLTRREMKRKGKRRKRCGRDLNLAVDGIGPFCQASTACVCPLIMAGKAAAAWDRDVPRPNCYIYAKRGWGRTRSVSVGYAGTHGVIKPSGPLGPPPSRGNARWGPNIRHVRKTQRAVNPSSRVSRKFALS